MLGLISWEGPDGRKAIYAGDDVTLWVGEGMFDPATAYPVSLDWSFGDGAQTSGNPVRHTYAREGRFLITATGQGGPMEQSLSVDLVVRFMATGPLRRPMVDTGETYDRVPFTVSDGAVASGAKVFPQSVPTSTIHVRILDPHRETIFEGASSEDEIVWWLEDPPGGPYELHLWSEGLVAPDAVQGEVRVIF